MSLPTMAECMAFDNVPAMPEAHRHATDGKPHLIFWDGVWRWCEMGRERFRTYYGAWGSYYTEMMRAGYTPTIAMQGKPDRRDYQRPYDRWAEGDRLPNRPGT